MDCDVLRRRLEDVLLDEMKRGLTRGSQIFVAHQGDPVVDIAVGECMPGTGMHSSTQHNLYCGLKPVVALAIAHELERHGVDVVESSVGDLLGYRGQGAVALADVLSHNAGLGEPRLIEYFLGNREAVDAALSLDSIVGRLAAGQPEYSETAAWVVLAAVCERIADRRLEAIFADHVAGTSPELMILLETAEKRKSVGFYFDMAADPPIPLLHDRVQRFAMNHRPGVAVGYGSASALGRWYVDVLRCRSGEEVSGFPSPAETLRWTSTQRSSVEDGTLGRSCSFGWGFMTDLASHGFGHMPSAKAFGSVGFMANSFAFADPEDDLVVASFTNGLSPDPRFNAEVTRPDRASIVYATLGLR